MRIGSTSAASFGQTDGRLPHDETTAQPKAESRALVVIAPQKMREDRPMAYRDASFLAHLIATKAHAPQTRERRRAEPEEAMAAYRAVAALTR